jgi:hypothetical protein
VQDYIAGVICMNTPFFAVFKRNATQLLLAFFPLAAMLSLYIGAGLFLYDPLDKLMAHWPRFLRGGVGLIVLTLFGSAVSSLSCWATHSRRK